MVKSSSEATGCTCNGGYRNGETCHADEDCQGGDQDSGYSWVGNCHDGQDNLGHSCTHACECTGGLLCSWHAGSLGGEDSDQISPMRYTYSTTLSSQVAADCPGGVTNEGTLTAVVQEGESGASVTQVKLAATAPIFEGIYVGFDLEVTFTDSVVDDWNQVRTFTLTERKRIIAYTSERMVTVEGGFTGPPTTSSTYKVHTSNNWAGYPTVITECPNLVVLTVAAVTNIAADSVLLIDDEIFHVRGVDVNGIQSITINTAGTSYTANGAATADCTGIANCVGSGFLGVCTVDAGGGVTSISVTTTGSGYLASALPAIKCSGGDTNLAAVPTLANFVTTLRGRSGSIAAGHAQGAAVYVVSGTGVQNYGVSGSDQMRASMQASTTLLTGGVLRRCATITLDTFKADSTDNIYRNWYVAITSGVGVAQSARIMHYDGQLKLAVVDCIEHGQVQLSAM